MRVLTIFYSLEGNTRFITNAINEQLHGDIIELKPKKVMPNKGFKKYLWGGKQVLLGERPEMQDIDIDFDKYDLIVFGTPVWAGMFAPVFNTFFSKYHIKDKDIALFCCHGGGKEGKTFVKFKEQLKDNKFLGEIAFEDPLKKNSDKNALNAKVWINSIVKE